MNETISSVFYAISFIVSLIVFGFLWWLAYRYPTARRLWGWLAVGWSVNTFSSLVWGLYALLVSEDIPDLIDGLYVLRYLFVGLAFWLYPVGWPWRRLVGVVASMLAAAAALWFGFVQPLRAISSQPFSFILAGTIFPLLDAGMLYIVWARWRELAGQSLRPVFGWLVLSALAYGVANWANYWVRAVNPEGNSLLALIGWLLTDVFVATAGWRFVKLAAKKELF